MDSISPNVQLCCTARHYIEAFPSKAQLAPAFLTSYSPTRERLASLPLKNNAAQVTYRSPPADIEAPAHRAAVRCPAVACGCRLAVPHRRARARESPSRHRARLPLEIDRGIPGAPEFSHR